MPHPQPLPLLLRCFCGCSELTRDEVQRYAQMNVGALLEDRRARSIFLAFLQTGHRRDQSAALQSTERYAICARLCDSESERTTDAFDELRDLSPSFAWEQRLDAAIESGESRALDGVLRELMFESKRAIEVHADYRRFQEEMMRKLGM